MIIRQFVLIGTEVFLRDDECTTLDYMFRYMAVDILVQYKKPAYKYIYKTKNDVFRYVLAYSSLVLDSI